MEERLQEAMEDFITSRMDDHGTNASQAVQDAISQLGACMARLDQSLNAEQKQIFQEVENALCMQTGEEMRYYYRAGLCDAAQMLLKCRLHH